MKASLVISSFVLTSFTYCTAFAESKANLDQRLASATTVIKEIMTAPDGGIPKEIVSHATCVGVIPSVKKAAFIVGASYGLGVVTCKNEKGGVLQCLSVSPVRATVSRSAARRRMSFW